jgi:dienelactone hydrolase
MSYLLYLPKGYDPKGDPRNSKPRPLMVFLMGVGERGSDLEGVMVHGPSAELSRNPKLGEDFPFIVLSPQCPANKRWDDPGMAQAVVALIDEVAQRWHADRSRIYLTGLSMGGKAVWQVACAAPDRFAAIAPISGESVDPQRVAAKLSGVPGVAVWIIVGAEDGGFTEGSRKMAQALKAANVDVTFTEVPHENHEAWTRFYPKPDFYKWFLANRRGQPPAPNRPTPEQLVAIAQADAPDAAFNNKLAAEFEKFLPYWQLLNCGKEMGGVQSGLKAELAGQKNVFVSVPLNKDVPCMFQTTATIGRGPRPTLHLLVGRDMDGQWDLIVRVEGKDLLAQAIDATSAPEGWAEVDVDLTPFAGTKARVELLNKAHGSEKGAAYWAKVAVDSR